MDMVRSTLLRPLASSALRVKIDDWRKYMHRGCFFKIWYKNSQLYQKSLWSFLFCISAVILVKWNQKFIHRKVRTIPRCTSNEKCKKSKFSWNRFLAKFHRILKQTSNKINDFWINFSRSRRQVEPALGDTGGNEIIWRSRRLFDYYDKICK